MAFVAACALAGLAAPQSAQALSWSGPLQVLGSGSDTGAVACPSTSECVVINSFGQVSTFDPASPGVPAVERLPLVSGLAIFACPSAHECVRDGGEGGSETFDPTSPCTRVEVGEEEEGAEALCEKEPLSKAGACEEDEFGCGETLPAGDESMACPSTTQCTVVGNLGYELTFNPNMVSNEQEAVQIDTSAEDDGLGNVLQAVACPSETRCVAIDFAGNEITFDPQSPSDAKLSSLGIKFVEEELAGYVTPQGLACPSIDQCTVVTEIGEVVTFDPASPGSPVPTVIEPDAGYRAVACPSISTCTAVGESDLGGIATTFDPATPEDGTTAIISGGETDVACPSTTLCVAVGEGGDEAFIGTSEGVPSNITPPKISGTAEAGQTLTEEHGTWTHHPTSFTFKWESCNASGEECTPIEGATSQTYLLAPQDVGHTIRVQETASNETGSSVPATSEVTALVQQEASGGGPSPDEQGGAPNESEMPTTCSCGAPVNTATGVLWHTFTDAHVPGLGIPLDFTRTYTSSAATVAGPLGFGWTDSYEMRLTFDAKGNAAVAQEDAAVASFALNAGNYQPAPGVLATLVKNGDGTYTFKRESTGETFLFDSSGRLVSEADRHGYETKLAYNGTGQLTKVTDQAGRNLTLAYSNGHLRSVSDPLGHTTTFEYDPAGDLTKTTDSLGRSWHFTYDAQHRLLTITDPAGGITTSTYDSSGRVIKQVDPAGRVLQFSYSGEDRTAAGGTTTLTDPRGLKTLYRYKSEELTSVTSAAGTAEAATTSYQYDPATFGQASVTDADGHSTTSTYDSRGDLLSSTDPLGKTTKHTYDSEGDLLTTTDALGVTTTNTYDAPGNLLSTSTPLSGGGTAEWSYTYGTGAQAGDRLSATNPDGDTTTYGYDSAGDRTSTTDPLSKKSTTTYDADGRLLTSTAPDGGTTTNVYDADGELTKTTDPLGHSSIYSYDANGNRTTSTDANGHTTTYTYDADNERTQTTQPDGVTTRTGFDADGNIISETDGNDHNTSYSFNALNQTASTTDPDGRTTRYTYDGVGDLLTSLNPSGQTTSYSYDADRRNTAIAYSDGTTAEVHEAYDADGRRTSLADGTGTSTFTYDTLGRLTGQTNGAGATSGYTYDAAGNVTQITYPNGKGVTRAYDADGRLTQSTDWLGNSTTFSYDGDGNPVSEHLPGTVTAQSAYNAADQLTGITDSNTGGTLASFTYTRDPVGLLTSSATTGALEATDDYSYDSQNRLTADNQTGYAYDAANDPTNFGGQPQRFDAAGQLLASGSASTGGGEGGGEEPAPHNSSGSSTTSTSSAGQTGAAAFHASSPPPVAIAATAKTHTANKHGKLSAGPLTTTSPNQLLLALVSAQGPAHGQRARSISGAGLHWSLLTEASSRQGTSSIWQAHAASPLKGVSFTATLAKAGYTGMFDVVAFAPGASVGPAAKRSGAHSRPSLALAASGAATIFAVAHDSGPAYARKALGGSHITDQALGRNGGTSWALSASGGTPSIGLGGSKSASWSLAAVAVLPAASAARFAGVRGASPAPPRLASRSAGSLSAPATAQGVSPLTESPASGETTYAYNAEGDRTAVTTHAGTTTLSYDQADRLTAVGEDIAYSYDGDGLRMSKTVAGETTAFAWDESHELPVLLQGGDTSYVYGPSGQPIEQITGSTATYLLGDEQGSTRLLTSSAGAVVGTYSYDAWGNVTSHTGEAATNLQYDGQYTDAETGYQYLRARYYDPATGELLSRDPLVNITRDPYVFTQGDAVNRSDPTGMCWADFVAAAQNGVSSAEDWLAVHAPTLTADAKDLATDISLWWAGAESSAAYHFSQGQFLTGALDFLPSWSGEGILGAAEDYFSSAAIGKLATEALNYFSINEQRVHAFLTDFPASGIFRSNLPQVQSYLYYDPVNNPDGPVTNPGLAPSR